MTDWTLIDKVTIFKGNDEDGNRYLSSFLQDYTKLYPNAEPQAGCNKCLETYYDKFIKKYKEMGNKLDTDSGYILKAKYQNIPLAFGSPILVNNSNITKEYAEILLKQVGGESLFEVIPTKNKSK